MKSQFLERVLIYGLLLFIIWLTFLIFMRPPIQNKQSFTGAGNELIQSTSIPIYLSSKYRTQNVFKDSGHFQRKYGTSKEERKRLRTSINITDFEEVVDMALSKPNDTTDLEIVDMLEHFFWGFKNGLAIEIGVRNVGRSMIHPLGRLGWRRVLVEGDPKYWSILRHQADDADIVTCPICRMNQLIHYANRSDHTAGIIEFMNLDFIRSFYFDIFESSSPPGNISSVNDWSLFPYVLPMQCYSMAFILSAMDITHVEFLMVDVAGAELNVLESIKFEETTFDVICVETDPAFRPSGHNDAIVDLLASHGYVDVAGQQGRNRWFVRNGFHPSERFKEETPFRGAQLSVLSSEASIHSRYIQL